MSLISSGKSLTTDELSRLISLRCETCWSFRTKVIRVMGNRKKFNNTLEFWKKLILINPVASKVKLKINFLIKEFYKLHNTNLTYFMLTELAVKLTGFILISVLLSGGNPVYSQNPIVPPGIYFADPAAHVWKDGKIYVYGSRDESPEYYCSYTHDVLFSADLIHWEIAENVFASRGSEDKVAYSDHLLYAPDCMYKNGQYYLYYCLANQDNTEGVAASNSPLGPFASGKAINPEKVNQIDPCVFIDDDGQAYYLWGQFTAKMAKLKSNMQEIDESTIRDSILTESEHFFHEGGFLAKRNGIYYFIYAHIGRANRPTCIGYATSSSPMGPYTYRGVIIDNDHCDPAVWNNHGSIVEMNDQWYVFYHRSTHGSVTMRKACIEPIYFNADGTINEVEMTTQGAGKPISAIDRMEAERACLLFGNVRIRAFDKDKEELALMMNDDKSAYKYIDFGGGVDSVLIRVAPGIEGARIEFAIDHSWGESIAAIDIPVKKGEMDWIELTSEIKGVTGVHALWLKFYGNNMNGMRVDWFQFK